MARARVERRFIAIRSSSPAIAIEIPSSSTTSARGPQVRVDRSAGDAAKDAQLAVIRHQWRHDRHRAELLHRRRAATRDVARSGSQLCEGGGQTLEVLCVGRRYQIQVLSRPAMAVDLDRDAPDTV